MYERIWKHVFFYNEDYLEFSRTTSFFSLGSPADYLLKKLVSRPEYWLLCVMVALSFDLVTSIGLAGKADQGTSTY